MSFTQSATCILSWRFNFRKEYRVSERSTVIFARKLFVNSFSSSKSSSSFDELEDCSFFFSSDFFWKKESSLRSLSRSSVLAGGD